MMKVQCSCGAKCVFEITEEMHHHPIRFSCPACGLDASEFVDGLIRQVLGQNATPPGRVLSINALPETPATSLSALIPPPPSAYRISHPNAQPTTVPSSAPPVRINRPEQP